MFDEDRPTGNAALASFKTYTVCTNLLCQMLEDLEIAPMAMGGGLRERYRSLVDQVRDVVRSANQAKLSSLAGVMRDHGIATSGEGEGVNLRERLEEELVRLPHSVGQDTKSARPLARTIDDLAPNDFKQAVAEAASAYAPGTVIGARELFRRALDHLQTIGRTRGRINVVQSNFARMHQYLLEMYEDDVGLRAYGRGKNLETAKVRFA